MVSAFINPNLIHSLEDCWLTYQRQGSQLLKERVVSHDAEAGFFNSQAALITRYESISKNFTQVSISRNIAKSLEQLGGYKSFGNLSDRQLDSFKQAFNQISRDMPLWIEGIKRKDSKGASLLKAKRWHRTHQVLTVPFIFVGLIAIFLMIGMRFYLNR